MWKTVVFHLSPAVYSSPLFFPPPHSFCLFLNLLSFLSLSLSGLEKYFSDTLAIEL